jgi:phosphoglucosamine mutase
MDVFLVGPMPTPAVAMLTRSLRCDIGVMISASHNPIRTTASSFSGPDGYKLSDDLEHRDRGADEASIRAAGRPGRIGRAKRSMASRPLHRICQAHAAQGHELSGMRVVLDCANGAAYKVAPAVLWELGAEVITIGDRADGTNINAQLRLDPPGAVRKVHEVRADVGIALDGDADRVLIVDETGAVVEGDQLMALIAEAGLPTIC